MGEFVQNKVLAWEQSMCYRGRWKTERQEGWPPAVFHAQNRPAVAGGEGLFNLALTGKGIVCPKPKVPHREQIIFCLENDVLKIDGSMAIAWSGSLNFTVEHSGKSLIGSATSGEGLVNVCRGRGRVLMAPIL